MSAGGVAENVGCSTAVITLIGCLTFLVHSCMQDTRERDMASLCMQSGGVWSNGMCQKVKP